MLALLNKDFKVNLYVKKIKQNIFKYLKENMIAMGTEIKTQERDMESIKRNKYGKKQDKNYSN